MEEPRRGVEVILLDPDSPRSLSLSFSLSLSRLRRGNKQNPVRVPAMRLDQSYQSGPGRSTIVGAVRTKRPFCKHETSGDGHAQSSDRSGVLWMFQLAMDGYDMI